MNTSESPPGEQVVQFEGPLSQEDAISTAKWLRLLIVIGAVLGLITFCGIVIRIGMSIHHTILLFSLGGLLAYAIDPLVERLRRFNFRGRPVTMSRTLAALLVFTGLFLCAAGAVWWLGGQTAAQFKALQKDAPAYRKHALELARDFDDRMLRPRNIEFSLEQSIQKPPPEVNEYAERAGKQVLPFLAHTASNVGESTVVVFIALYLLIFSEEMKKKFNGMLSERLRTYVVPWQRDANRILGGFVRGQITLAILLGICAAVGLLALGVHLWLVIGLFVIIASLIPVIGPYLAAVPAIIAALVGPTHLQPVPGAVVVAILFIVLNEGGSKVLYPRMVGKALNLQEVVVLFVLFAGLELGGIVGTLFAAPVAALAVITVVHLYRLWQELPEESMADHNDGKPEHEPNKALKLLKKAKGSPDQQL
jgi:predicted PurR-regulated permease PerM